MRNIIFLCCLLLIQQSFSQQLGIQQLQDLQQQEKVLIPHAQQLIQAEGVIERYRADSFFTRGLVKALKTPYSFFYNFDSLQTISKLYAPDSSFRIFTWQLVNDETSIRQKGAIQMQTTDGSLKLYPLIDYSEVTDNPFDSARTNLQWIGAIYYKIILTTYNNKKYYTLLGFDEHNEKSNRKWIEVLTFDEAQVPKFGGRYFQYPEEDIKPKQPAYRFCLEYKKEARAKLTYDTTLKMIVFDHLISEEKNTLAKQTLIPDGDFEGFKWEKNKWNYVAKIFDYKVDMQGIDPMIGNAPLPAAIKDKSGKSNEKLLEEISKKNGAPVDNPHRVDYKKKKKENPKQKEAY